MDLEGSDLKLKTNTDFIKQKLNFFTEKMKSEKTDEEFMREDNMHYEKLGDEFTKENANSAFIQYSLMYHLRLNEMKNNIITVAEQKWSSSGAKICKNILDVKGTVSK